ncbi:hypothetical protein B0H13DRAFT_368370 [Mycena leptocephala]|nr:hypothetical protein B0H13DRAFT_368370 [Mycena leptocephala]
MLPAPNQLTIYCIVWCIRLYCTRCWGNDTSRLLLRAEIRCIIGSHYNTLMYQIRIRTFSVHHSLQPIPHGELGWLVVESSVRYIVECRMA